MVIIKVMQVMLIIVTSKDISEILANEVLKLCMKEFKSKNLNIKNNAIAVLRQMYSLLFQEYSEKLSNPEEIKEGNLEKTCCEQDRKSVV